MDRSLREQFAIHPIKLQFYLKGVNKTRIQFPVRRLFACVVLEDEGKPLVKVLVYLSSGYFHLDQTYVAMSRLSKSEDVLLMQRIDDKPTGENALHQVPVAVYNLVLKGAVPFSEGTNVQ